MSIDNSALAQDFESILQPAVTKIDKAIQSVKTSQDELGNEIERLVAELELFKDITEPPQLQPVLEKLLDAKKRLTNANMLMTKTKERVERTQKELLNIK
ncbi:MAG: hypothetical protein EXX96DRAFT_14315 [Benjaminiella poitrasii]|nr:MAG: hypothetical protein EXX96DRAFT_14315 [Benjaminiella poitrasii]